MKQYIGIIFNSKNVETLIVSLRQTVGERCICTTIFSRKNRMVVKRMLKTAGLNVDVTVGGLNFNTRYMQFVKPMSGPMLLALGGDDNEPGD